MKVTKSNGQLQALDIQKIHNHAEFACEGLEGVSQSELETSAHITFYEGMPTKEIQQTLILTAADKIKEHYNWNFVASRLLLMSLFKEVTNGELVYPSLKSYIDKAVALGELSPEMADNGFDFARLDAAIKPERDMKFTYLGLSTLMDRYFRRDSANGNGILELPQHFYMRVAMGLTLYGVEDASETTDRAIEFYDNLSSFDFHNSTPTLFNAGTRTPQLSSCYLLSMGDSLDGIMGTCTEAANYSKLSGGIGIDMSQVRGNGSLIKGTSGRSGGIVPFAKTTESTIAAFNQMGKRKGAGALYLADWHMDVEHFLDLKNETGDPRTRIPDLQTAVWLSDLLLERKEDPEAMFSLFCPNTVPALNETYGEEFRKIYEQAEAEGLYVKQVRAKDLWKKIINSAFDTGSYYHGHKDMINRRSMQKGTGMVRSSNLCTEITLNTVPNEVSAVCNIGSLNLANYTTDEALEKTIRTSVRMLDNVVSIGLVPHVNGRRFQDMERAIGLGIMGEAEYLAKHNIPFDSMEHLVHTATFMKKISRFTIEASADLATERGAYPLFEQSEWAKGVLPYDTAPALAKYLIPGFSWDYADDAALRAKTMKGMRNSHTMAIAPTATISNIVGTSSCTELPLELVDVKENLSGTFVDRAPTLKYQTEEQAQTAREVDQWWVLAAAGVRQVYIDQAQSTNLFLPIGMKYADGTQVKGSTISDWYSFAGQVLKTTYYLRNVNSGAKTDADKAADAEATLTQEQIYCSIENPGECESCQ